MRIPKKIPPDHLLLTSGTVLIGIPLRSDSTTVTIGIIYQPDDRGN
jgi:hypothetical protein